MLISLFTLSQTSPGFYMSAVQVFWKHSGKKRNSSWRAISPFLQCFLPIRRNFCHFHQVLNCRLLPLSVWKSLRFVVWERVNAFSHNDEFWCSWGKSLSTLSQTSPGFSGSALQVFWKHWVKEKLLYEQFPLFSHIVFYPFWELTAIFSSTGHRPASLCHGPLSVVRPSVNFFFKHLLRWNYLSDFDEISQKCFHHGPLQNFLK